MKPLFALGSRLAPLRQLRVQGAQLLRQVRGIPQRHANPYATHVPVLVALGQVLPVRRVLELGCGQFSTATLLDRELFPSLCRLDSYEHDPAWAARVEEELGADKRLHLCAVDEPMSAVAARLPISTYDLIFIDDSLTAEARAATIQAVAAAELGVCVAVIHDFEQTVYQQAAAGFRHRFAFTALNPFTGVAWNDAPLHGSALRRFNRLIASFVGRTPPEARSLWLALLR